MAFWLPTWRQPKPDCYCIWLDTTGRKLDTCDRSLDTVDSTLNTSHGGLNLSYRRRNNGGRRLYTIGELSLNTAKIDVQISLYLLIDFLCK